MALPPIITNSPLFKAVTGSQDKKTSEPESENAPAQKVASKDTINLSSEAINKLQADALKNENSARETARDVGLALAKDQNFSLSKDGEGLGA